MTAEAGASRSGTGPEAGLLEQLNRVCGQDAVAHVGEDPSREAGGFLIGRPGPEGARAPEVEFTIRARHAIERRARLTFTHETWLEVYAELDRRELPEGTGIVGWYHSHPSAVIFLSGHDLFIHHNFFAAPHQVAVVIDPHVGEFGTFGWDDGEVVLIDGRSG